MDFIHEASKLGIIISQEMLEKYEKYYSFLIEENEKINLTNITEHDEVFLKHFYDSLTLVKGFNFQTNVEICDIGAGAGFPSIPLKIAFPNIKVLIVDSLRKRCDFLNRLIELLDLRDVRVIWGRAEEIKEKFDVVTARAVARMNILVELCLPLVKEGGYFISMKGLYEEELNEAMNGINVLGGNVHNKICFQLEDGSERSLVVVKKVKETPSKYPRSFGNIKKKPL